MRKLLPNKKTQELLKKIRLDAKLKKKSAGSFAYSEAIRCLRAL
jgi:hypothetical protein